MTKRKKVFGKWGEKKAADFLVENGYSILEENFRTDYGELDIIAIRDNLIAFVEVKTRSSDAFGFPEEAVTENKIAHLQKSVQSYFILHPEMESMEWRIDVIAIRKVDRTEKFEIVWFENAVF